MSANSLLYERVKKLCASQKFAVLATQDDTQPYCNFIAFSVSDDLAQIFFATLKNTNHAVSRIKVSALLNIKPPIASILRKLLPYIPRLIPITSSAIWVPTVPLFLALTRYACSASVSLPFIAVCLRLNPSSAGV